MGYVLPPKKKKKKTWNSTIWLDFHTEMCELHVDLRKQNQPPHPEILITKFLKKNKRKNVPMECKMQITETSRRSFACNGDRLVFAPINFNICSSVMPS